MINVVLCAIQYVSGEVIVQQIYLVGNSIYKSVFYYGDTVRTCGLFTSALDVGVLLLFTF